MNLKFDNMHVTGILSVVPKHCVKFMDEIENYGYSPAKCLNLMKTIGFDERRIVQGDECTSDLCLYGLEHLLQHDALNTDDIGALIFVSQTPDHFMPPTSAILHGKLGLKRDALCFDINQGCAGYIYGLLQAYLLLQLPDIGKVVLLNGDTLSRRCCPLDRNVYPLIGDAGTVTILEKSTDPTEVFLSMEIDGSRSDWLKIPAGAFRMPSTEQTREIRFIEDGIQRSDEDFYMNGAGVFTFTQTDVPKSIMDLFEYAQMKLDDIDYFMFHQPNRFMLKKLAWKLGVPEEKMPNNIVEKFGNPSSASIPLNICYNIGDSLRETKKKICMCGFGVGLSWGSVITDIGPLEYCELIEK